IVQILVNNSPPIISGKSKTDHNSEQHIGVVHIDGTVDVYQYNTVLSNQNTTLTRAYHSGDDDVGEHYSNSQKESVFNRNGRVKPCAVFLSSSSSDHSWRLLASSGLSDISSSPQSSASASLSVESHNTRHLLNYQLQKNSIPSNKFNIAPYCKLEEGEDISCQCFKEICNSHLSIIYEDAKQPYIETSELNANDVQVTLIMQGLQAPSRGFCGLIKPGCSGNFRGDSCSSTSSSIREQLANGLLKVELGEYTLSVLCELTNPNDTFEYHVRRFPSKIMPTFCTYKVSFDLIVMVVNCDFTYFLLI
ncbi:unnamed protein product, partial [Trichobilharzia regenti]